MQLLSNWDYKREVSRYEKIHDVIALTNGKLVAVGETTGEDYESTDGLLIVLNAAGERESWKQFGTKTGTQTFKAVTQNHDGTLLVVGHSAAYKGDEDGWIMKLDLDGNIIEEQFPKGPSAKNDRLLDVDIAEDGTVIAVGQRDFGKSNLPWLLRIDPDFNITELNTLNTTLEIAAIAAQGNNFCLMGNTGNKNKKYTQAIWANLIDTEGNTVWAGPHFYDHKGFQEGKSISASKSDDGFLIAGSSNYASQGQSDMWFVRISNDGELIWDNTYGGPSADFASDVIELNQGGYAILGSTYSYMPVAKYANIQLLLLDEAGNEIGQDYYPMFEQAGIDQFGFAMTESFESPDIIITGNSNPSKDFPITALSAVSYTDSYAREEDDDTFGSDGSGDIQISNARWVDENTNQQLDPNERGYMEFTITNTGDNNYVHVVASAEDNNYEELDIWSSIHIGALKSGEEKKIRVPIKVDNEPQKENYTLNYQVEATAGFLGNANAKLKSHIQNPADVIVNRAKFSPEVAPGPNESILLTVEVINNGGAESEAILADIYMDAGVEAEASERFEIPALAAGEKHYIKFPFHYTDNYFEPNLKIVVATEATDDMAGIKKSITLDLPNNVVAEARSVEKVVEMDEIFWTSHDITELRSIDVNRKEIDIKALAVSKNTMEKKNFAVLINGKRLQGQKLDESDLSPPKSQSYGRNQQTYSNKIRLDDGENKVEIVYYEANGKDIKAKSEALTFNFTPMDKPNLHVLAIGVHHKDLKYTVKDATDFTEMYLKLRDDKGRGFKKVNIYPMLKEDETTATNIKKAFIGLERDRSIKDNDLVVVFISSHGKVSSNTDRYILLPTDYDPQYEDLTSVDFNEDVLKKLRNIDGNKLVFIDACHSGSAGSRSFSDEAASKVMNDLISATAGMEIFASCGDNEFSYEDENWENGAFTKAIKEAFTNTKVDVNGKTIQADIYNEINGTKEPGSDGVITIEELKLFVQNRVPFLVQSIKNKTQHPTNKSTDLLPSDMGIYMVN